MRRDPSPAGYQANRTHSVLPKMFNLAELWGLRPDGSNPYLHVKRFREDKRERFLSTEEFNRLGRVLDEMSADGSETRSAVAALRLLMLTGCRLSEVQKLRWEYVDLDAGELRLPNTKTSGRAVPLAPSAVKLLAALPRDPDSPWVIAGRKPGAHLTDLQHPWRRIRARGPRRRAHPRPTSQLRLPRLGARRRAADDRETARPYPGPDHRPLHPPRPRYRQGLRRSHRRQH